MIKDLFQKRLTAFCDNLFINKQGLWGNSDVVVIHSKQQENPNSLSSQFYFWLCGEKFLDTTTIFTPSGIYFLCTEKHYSRIRFLCCPATLVRRCPVSVQLKARNDDGFAFIDSTIRNARVIHISKGFTSAFGDDGNQPFVVGFIEGEYPKSKLFWNCMNGLETRKYKVATVNCGIRNLVSSNDLSFGGGVSREKREVLKSLSDLCTDTDDDEEEVFLPFTGKGNRSAMSGKEKSNLEYKFGRIGLREEGRSDLGSELDITKLFLCEKSKSRVNEIPLWTTKTNDDDSQMMEFPTLRSLEQDKFMVPNMYVGRQSKFEGIWVDDGKEYNLKAGNKNGDHVFKFGESVFDGKDYKSKGISKNGNHVFKFGESLFDGKEYKSKGISKCGDHVFKFGESVFDGNEYKPKGISKNGDPVFKFGPSKLDGKDSISKEGDKNWDQLFTFGEGKKDGDQLFKFGEQCKIGEKRARNNQAQLIMEENKGTKDVKQLTERLTAFYSSWRKYKEEQWGKADVLVITTPSVAPVKSLSHSFLVWLLDDEFPETTTVFTNTGIEFLCTKESFFRLRTIGIRMTMVAKITVSVQLKKRGEQCVDWLKKTLWQVNTVAKSGANWCPFVVGCISGESGEMEALSDSKIFEVAYVDSSLANLLEQGTFEKPESFAAQQSALPKQFQTLSLGTCSGAKTANAVSFSELAKIRSMDDNSYLSLLSKELCAGAKTPTDLDNGGPVEQSKPEENKVLEEDNSSRKLADKVMLLEIKEGDMETSITEDSAEEKLLVEEQNMLPILENSPLLQVEEHGEQSRSTEGGMYYSVQPNGVTDVASENSLPDDNNGSLRKDSVGSDHEDDDWTLIEMECQGQETEVAERVSWTRWFMGKTGKSFGLKDEVSDEAPSKRTKADP